MLVDLFSTPTRAKCSGVRVERREAGRDEIRVHENRQRGVGRQELAREGRLPGTVRASDDDDLLFFTHSYIVPRMRAILLTRHGGPDVLKITDVPTPTPRPGEVRVRIHAVGINFAEVLSRRGLYGWAPSLPYILGMEGFGEIDAVGDGVTSHKVGDRVIAGTQFGAYAEFICIPAERALVPPPGLSTEESAAFAVNFMTAWIGLMEMARLRPTDTVLVTAAAGGVGSAAVQIAKKFGARVIGAAGKGKQDAVRALGADLALDYTIRAGTRSSAR